MSQVDHESVQATALKVVFDLLHVFGFEAFNVGPVDEGETGKGRGKSEGTEEVGDLCMGVWSHCTNGQ